MRFSLPIAVALLLGSYVAGAPISSPEEGEIIGGGYPGHNRNTPGGSGVPASSLEEGEITDHGSPGHLEEGEIIDHGSPERLEEGEITDHGFPGNTPEGSHHSGGSGASSDPSIGLGLDRQHRGELGSTELRHYATPERYEQSPTAKHWTIRHPVVVHGQRGSDLAITPMTSSRRRITDHPAEKYGFSHYKKGSHLEVAGGLRFIPVSEFHRFGKGEGSMQQTAEGYRGLVRAIRKEINQRPGNPSTTLMDPSQVAAPMYGQRSGGASTSRQSAQFYSGPRGMPPDHPLPQRPPPPLRQSAPPYQIPQGLPARPPTGLPPPPDGSPAGPPSRGGSRSRGSARYQPYPPRGPGGAGPGV